MSELVKLCEQVARMAHRKQVRRMGDDKGKPYIVHPERVAKKMDNDISKSVAWLHDVLEDTLLTRFDLESVEIPEEIIRSVESVTRRDEENYLDFILRVKKDATGRHVKIADIEDNMENLDEGSLKDKYRLALWILKQEN